ncbi:MAG: hypothetical protein Q8Q25_01210, partial [bacterium]|nr:hypothetical protein [bacterium]
LQQQTGVRDLEKALGKNNQCVITQKDRGTLLGCCIVCTGVSCLTVGAMALCRHLVNCTGDPYWSPIQ